MNSKETVVCFILLYCLPGRAVLGPQDQDPTVKTAIFLEFLTPNI